MAEEKALAFLTKEAFENLLTKAAQPIRKPPAPEAERTSAPRLAGD
jgi:hypothetical protein